MSSHSSKMVFNYPLPTEYYQQPQQHRRPDMDWVSPNDHQHALPRTIPTVGYVDPRQLSRSYSTSSDEMDFSCTDYTDSMDLAFRQRQCSMTTQPHRTQGLAYMTAGYSTTNSGRRGSTNKHSSGQYSLPSPPLSPLPQSSAIGNFFPSIEVDQRYLDTPTVVSGSRNFCDHKDCMDSKTGKPRSFSRHADLVRHQRSIHGMMDGSEKFDCPRPKCNRKGDNGFTRKDHLTEHRRGYHHEVVPRRRSSATGSKSPRS